MIRAAILAGVTSLFLAALAVVIWQSSESQPGEVGADPLTEDKAAAEPVLADGSGSDRLLADDSCADAPFTEIGVHGYRGTLAADEHPSLWVPQFPTVALVTVEEMGKAKWSSESGDREGWDGSAPPPVPAAIFTPTTLRVDEYLKGSGVETIVVAIWGGVVDCVSMDMQIPITVGDRAVVFLRNAPSVYGGPIVDNAYVIDGDGAYSNLDEKQLSVTDLLSGLRSAAALSQAD